MSQPTFAASTTTQTATYAATATVSTASTTTTTSVSRSANASMYSASSIAPASPAIQGSAARGMLTGSVPASPYTMVPASPAIMSSATTAAYHGSNPNSLLQYQLALIFFKKERNNGKLSYAQNNRLGALTKQAAYGSYEIAKPFEPGFFDLVGKDKKAAWVELGNMTGEEAMEVFLKELSASFPEFDGWMKERLFEQLEQERREQERRAREEYERQSAERELIARLQRQEAERVRQEEERAQRLALEQQRLREQQLEQQRQLMLQQEEQQRRLMQEQQEQQRQLQQRALASSTTTTTTTTTTNGDGYDIAGVHVAKSKYTEPEFLKSFIEATKGKADSELAISRGEMVTVRVPKEKAGSVQLIWEFCTEDYDISFGLEFEKKAVDGVVPTVIPILPIMRVNSNVHVINGSHTTNDIGCWMLKFDNTYSYLRSKTVLYRVFCKPA